MSMEACLLWRFEDPGYQIKKGKKADLRCGCDMCFNTTWPQRSDMKQCCEEMHLDRYTEQCGCQTEYCYKCNYMALSFACEEHWGQEEE